jgi:hypothetical protein
LWCVEPVGSRDTGRQFAPAMIRFRERCRAPGNDDGSRGIVATLEDETEAI